MSQTNRKPPLPDFALKDDAGQQISDRTLDFLLSGSRPESVENTGHPDVHDNQADVRSLERPDVRETAKQAPGHPVTRTSGRPDVREPEPITINTEQQWPSRMERRRKTIRLPEEDLQFWEDECHRLRLDFQEAVWRALSAMYGRPDVRSHKRPVTQAPKRPDVRSPAPYKELDHGDWDNDLKKNHYPETPPEVRALYEQGTGNTWTAEDDWQYVQLSNPLLVKFLPALRTFIRRAQKAQSQVKNFSYFAIAWKKEITPEQIGDDLAQQYRDIRAMKGGLWDGASPSRLEELTEQYCRTNKIEWDKHAFNESLTAK